jgi:predicted Zn-dependent protease
LRFFRQASQLKPEFLPAKVGLGRAFLALGLADDADRLFDEALAAHPEDVEARLGKAAVLGARAQPKAEIEMYRSLLAEDDARTEVRAHLVAALVEMGDWRSGRIEIERMLARTPEEPQLRFLHAAALAHTGQAALGEEERAESRRLGLTYEQEVALCKHLGLAAPPRPKALPGSAGTRRAPVAGTPSSTPPKRTANVPVKARESQPVRTKAPAHRPSSSRRSAPRKRK